jgi:hypothetical protein
MHNDSAANCSLCATGVASWRVLAGTSPTRLAAIGIYPTQGFETAIAAPTEAP